MSNLKDGFLTIPLGSMWVQLPQADENVDERVDQIVEELKLGVDDAASRSLASALRTVTGVAAGLPAGARESHALVISPSAGRVEALLSIRVSKVTSDAYDNYLRIAREFKGNDTSELINRVVEEIDLPIGRSVLSRDFVLPTSDSGVPDPAMERVFLAVFPVEFENAVELTLLTQNLALFPDASSYLVSLAMGENPVLIGMEEN